MVPQQIISRAVTQSQFNGTQTNIYKMTGSGTYVIAPEGYFVPREATLVGIVSRDGHFTSKEDIDRLQERNSS